MSNARNLAVLATQETAFKNKLLNGAFDVWQRGVSFSGTYDAARNYYTADRWQGYRNGAVAGATFSRVLYNGPNAMYAMRMQRNSGDTQTNGLNISQPFETAQVHLLRGKTVTVSFRYLTGANFSDTGGFRSAAVWGTGTDGNTGSGFTNHATASNNAFPVSPTQSYVSFTFTVPSNATQFALNFYFAPTGTAGANDWVEVTNIQLEIGSVPTAFEYRPPHLETLLCKRYWERVYVSHLYYAAAANAYGGVSVPFQVPKRITPTAQAPTGGGQINILANSVGVNVNNENAARLYMQAANAGTTEIQHMYVDFNAEQ